MNLITTAVEPRHRECNLCGMPASKDEEGILEEEVLKCAHFDGQVLLLHIRVDPIVAFICCVPEGKQNNSEDHYEGYIKRFEIPSEAEAKWPDFEEAFLKGGDTEEFRTLFEHTPSSE